MVTRYGLLIWLVWSIAVCAGNEELDNGEVDDPPSDPDPTSDVDLGLSEEELEGTEDNKTRICDKFHVKSTNDVIAVKFNISDFALIRVLDPETNSAVGETTINGEGIFRASIPRDDSEWEICFVQALNPNFTVKYDFFVDPPPGDEYEWQTPKTKNNPLPRAGHAAARIDNKWYIFGGYDGDEELKALDIFNLDTNEWKKGKSMDRRRVGHTVNVYNGQLFIFGGKDETHVWNDMSKYDPATDTYTVIKTKGEHTPSNRFGQATIVLQNKMYLWSGEGEPKIVKVQRTKGALAREKWHVDREEAQLEAQHKAFEEEREYEPQEDEPEPDSWGPDADEMVEVEVPETHHFMEFWEFDLDTYEWKMLPIAGAPSEAGAGALFVSYNNKLLLLGGTAQGLGWFTWANQFSFNTNKWEEIELHGVIPSARGGHQIVQLDENRFLFGGGIAHQIMEDVHVLNPAAQTMWPLPAYGGAPTVGHAWTLYNGYLFSFGGFMGPPGMTNEVKKWKVDLKAFDSWAHKSQLKVKSEDEVVYVTKDSVRGDPYANPEEVAEQERILKEAQQDRDIDREELKRIEEQTQKELDAYLRRMEEEGLAQEEATKAQQEKQPKDEL